MQSFNLNNKQVRFFNANETIYLITADAKKAFGFEGRETSIDRASQFYDSVEDANCVTTKELRFYTKVIQFKELVRVIIRSSKGELVETQDLFCQMVVNGFGFNATEEPQQKALPQGSTGDRVANISSSLHLRYQGLEVPQDKVNLPGWLTVAEMLETLGEDPKSEYSLIKDGTFRYWINREMSSLYRGETGQEPPSVGRNKGKGFVYPTGYRNHVSSFRSIWLGSTATERKQLGGGN